MYKIYNLTLIPFSLKYFLTRGTGYSSKWKILAANAAETSVFSNASLISLGLPTPPEAITGISTASLIDLVKSRS